MYVAHTLPQLCLTRLPLALCCNWDQKYLTQREGFIPGQSFSAIGWGHGLLEIQICIHPEDSAPPPPNSSTLRLPALSPPGCSLACTPDIFKPLPQPTSFSLGTSVSSPAQPGLLPTYPPQYRTPTTSYPNFPFIQTFLPPPSQLRTGSTSCIPAQSLLSTQLHST